MSRRRVARWIQDKDILDSRCTVQQRDSLYAGPGNESSGGVQIREHYNYNGSGFSSFGGAKKWPVLTLRVSLPEGREDLRSKLSKHLRKVIDEFIAENELEK